MKAHVQNHKTKPAVLFMTRNGLMEPLGQSQIVSYVKRLAQIYDFTICSFEKADVFDRQVEIEQIQRKELEYLGIKWNPINFKRFSFINLIFAFLQMLKFSYSFTEVNQKNCFIHARSYFPAFVAWINKKLTNCPYVFDMRGFWFDELIASGRMPDNSIIYFFALKIESLLISGSSLVIVLTHEAKVCILEAEKRIPNLNEKIVVIPTCVDEKLFSKKKREREVSNRIFLCFGTVLSGWFDIDALRMWIDFVLGKDACNSFIVLTKDNAIAVRDLLDPNRQWGSRLAIEDASREDVVKTLGIANLSCFFYSGSGRSEIGRCPTRLAESLAVGVPVMAVGDVGDTKKLLEQYGVGFHASEVSIDFFETVYSYVQKNSLGDVSNTGYDKITSEVFSLDRGIERFREGYKNVIQQI